MPASDEPEEDFKPAIDTLTSALMSPLASRLNLMMDKIEELKDLSQAAPPTAPVSAPDPSSSPQFTYNIDADLAWRLSHTKGQQQQLMLHNIQAQLQPPPLKGLATK